MPAKKNDEQQSEAKAPKDKNPHLVSMHKDGQTIEVHPNGVAEHEKLGWRQVEAAA